MRRRARESRPRHRWRPPSQTRSSIVGHQKTRRRRTGPRRKQEPEWKESAMRTRLAAGARRHRAPVRGLRLASDQPGPAQASAPELVSRFEAASAISDAATRDQALVEVAWLGAQAGDGHFVLNCLGAMRDSPARDQAAYQCSARLAEDGWVPAGRRRGADDRRLDRPRPRPVENRPEQPVSGRAAVTAAVTRRLTPPARSPQPHFRHVERRRRELHVHLLERLDDDLRDGEVAEPFVVRRDDEPRRLARCCSG